MHRLSPSARADNPRTVRPLVLLSVALALSGCSLFGGPFQGKEKKAVAERQEPPKPTALAPVATHRFQIDPAGDDVVGLMQSTIASKEDTLPDIARRFDIGYEEIVRANPGVDPWLPGEGRAIVLPTRFILPNAPREGIVINIPAMRLFYYPAHQKDEPAEVITYPIGIGRVGWQTPEGQTKIVKRTLDPVWTVPVSIRKEHAENGDDLPPVVGPGPDNPLGKHSFTLQWQGYLVHGTNKPYGVGMRSSHGCIRLYPEDIEQLFDTVPLGTKLRVVNQPVLFGRNGDSDVLVQAYGALEDDKRDWSGNARKLMEKSIPESTRKAIKDQQLSIDWDRVHGLLAAPRGVPVSIISTDASLDGELLAARKVQNAVPEGSNWDGKVEVDEAKFEQLLSESEPATTATAADGTAR
ncbi:MAG TPA: L,D-transpeptidase family protein [Steroidobacteraceae bacterium]